MLEAETQFRKVIRYSDLAKLAVAIEHDPRSSTGPTPTQEVAIPVLPDHHTGTVVTKFHDERDILRCHAKAHVVQASRRAEGGCQTATARLMVLS